LQRHVGCGSWLCENPEIEISDRKVRLDFVNLKNKNADQPRLDKTIEKAILRVPRAQAFPHSLGHSRPIGTISGMSALPVNATATGNTFHDVAHGSFNKCAAHS
jgi:hypothetical protein